LLIFFLLTRTPLFNFVLLAITFKQIIQICRNFHTLLEQMNSNVIKDSNNFNLFWAKYRTLKLITFRVFDSLISIRIVIFVSNSIFLLTDLIYITTKYTLQTSNPPKTAAYSTPWLIVFLLVIMQKKIINFWRLKRSFLFLC